MEGKKWRCTHTYYDNLPNCCIVILVTCADEDTYAEAMKNPEKYDLLRVRMGGWTEHFVAMFNAHKKQQMRRPFYSP